MSVLINGMAMPKSCLLCPFGDEFGKCCVNAELEDAKELTHSCPLVELPDHGDLIDRDVVADALDLMAVHGRLRDAFDMVMSCEAVIPAERTADICDAFGKVDKGNCSYCEKMERRVGR